MSQPKPTIQPPPWGSPNYEAWRDYAEYLYEESPESQTERLHAMRVAAAMLRSPKPALILAATKSKSESNPESDSEISPLSSHSRTFPLQFREIRRCLIAPGEPSWRGLPGLTWVWHSSVLQAMKSAGLDADDLRIAARRIFGESIANGLGADLPTMRTLFAWRFVATPKDFPGMLPEESKVPQQSRATGECCCRMWYRKLIADVSIHVDPRTRLTYALIGNMQRIDL